MACHLRDFPHLGLLISKTPGETGATYIKREQATLAAVRDESRKLGHPLLVVPFDTERLWVGCPEGHGNCAAFLEIWLSEDENFFWKMYGNSSPELGYSIKRLKTEHARKTACNTVLDLQELARKSFFIKDEQGFVNKSTGEVIFADPAGFYEKEVASFTHYKKTALQDLKRVLKKLCRDVVHEPLSDDSDDDDD